MKHSENVKDIATALAKAQGELHNPNKDKEGYNYKYADLGQILDIVRPVLSKHGLSVSQFLSTHDNAVVVETMLLHESGEWLSNELKLPYMEGKGMNAAQSIGSVSTYGRRYSLAAIVGLAQEDDDGSSSKAPQNYQQPQQTQAKPPKQPSLNEYLKSHGVSKVGDFTKRFGIASKDQALDLLKGEAGLNAMIEEFKAEQAK